MKGDVLCILNAAVLGMDFNSCATKETFCPRNFCQVWRRLLQKGSCSYAWSIHFCWDNSASIFHKLLLNLVFSFFFLLVRDHRIWHS